MMCAASLLPTVAFADDSDLDETSTAVEPADVFVRVALVRDELENLRFVMGRPANTQPEPEVSDAVPREVFFQALTLSRKADRLCFEYTREHAPEPAILSGTIQPAAVYAVVDAALERIRRVKQRLDIVYEVKTVTRDPRHTPTHVFRSMVQANRQLNLLLDRQFSPADV